MKLRITLLVVIGLLVAGGSFTAGKLGYGPLKETNALGIYNEKPVRITGKFDDREIDLGPVSASNLHVLLSHATSPGRNKCADYGVVTLHYASGKAVVIRVGCCTAWIDGKSWHVGNSAMRNFFDAKE